MLFLKAHVFFYLRTVATELYNVNLIGDIFLQTKDNQ